MASATGCVWLESAVGRSDVGWRLEAVRAMGAMERKHRCCSVGSTRLQGGHLSARM